MCIVKSNKTDLYNHDGGRRLIFILPAKSDPFTNMSEYRPPPHILTPQNSRTVTIVYAPTRPTLSLASEHPDHTGPGD